MVQFHKMKGFDVTSKCFYLYSKTSIKRSYGTQVAFVDFSTHKVFLWNTGKNTFLNIEVNI